MLESCSRTGITNRTMEKLGTYERVQEIYHCSMTPNEKLSEAIKN